MTVDCMACLVALARGWPSNGTYKGANIVLMADYADAQAEKIKSAPK